MDLLHLEQQRQALESSLEKLRASLKHWQTWEAEYEGLKEELQNVDGDVTADGLATIAKTYDGELVNEKEVHQLSGLDNNSPRSAAQIIGLIERRQEYVQKNIETVQRQFFEAEAKAEELAFAAARESPGADAGLPLTEIHEELDDDGNVISSQLSRPEETTAKVVESLRQAGLSEEDLEKLHESKPKPEELKPAITNASPPITPSASNLEKRGHSDNTLSRSNTDDELDLERPPIRKKSVSFTADTKSSPEPQRPESEDGRKQVSFNDKVAVMPAAPPPDNRSVSFSPNVEEIPPQPLGPASPNTQPKNEEQVQKELRESFKPGEKVARLNEDDELESIHYVVPEDESPDDARTRREMLEYHLNEVGNVVAQIDLEEPDLEMDQDEDEYDEDDSSSFYTTSEYLDDEDTPYTTGLSESEESEDEHGRTKRNAVSPQYRKQMEELQQKLIGNLGPSPKDENIQDAEADLDPKGTQRMTIRNKRSSTSSASSDNSEKKPGGKKRVSFAESLDVNEPTSPPLKAQKLQGDENVAPFSDNVTERTTAMSHSLPEGMANENVSRFKQARMTPITHPEDETAVAADEEMDDAPSGPPGVTIADTLMERPQASKPIVAPSADDPDPLLERRELAAEYYRRRNDMIRQQGGFKTTADEDEGLGELMEERDGKVKKVSRFKAARIKPQS